MYTNTHTNMHIHTGRGCIAKEEEEGKGHISVTARETDLYLFLQLSYALALLAFHSFFLAWGRNAPADVLLHCDWLIQSCFGKLCPPPHCSSSALCRPPSPPSVLSPFLVCFCSLNFFSSNEVMLYVRECWQDDIE